MRCVFSASRASTSGAARPIASATDTNARPRTSAWTATRSMTSRRSSNGVKPRPIGTAAAPTSDVFVTLALLVAIGETTSSSGPVTVSGVELPQFVRQTKNGRLARRFGLQQAVPAGVRRERGDVRLEQQLSSTHLPGGSTVVYATAGAGPPLLLIGGW